MNKNEFDRLLNEKFDQHEFAYNHAGWEKLASQLPAKRSARVLPFSWLKVTGVAAALAITLGGVALYYQSQSNPKEAIAVKGPTSQPIIPSSNQPTVESINTTDEEVLSAPSVNKTSIAARPSRNQKEQPISEQNSTSPTTTNTELERNIEPNLAGMSEPILRQKSEAVTLLPEKKSSPAFNDPFIDPVFEPKTKSAEKTFFSLTGGMNYGSMNTGYTAGINAKQKLGKKVYLEGDLAVLGNRAQQTFTQQQQQASLLMKAPIDYRDANLVYVAFNPSIGYQLLKKVSVGVGADVQRMVNGDDLLVQIDEETEKTIPGTDLGLTGKTEVSVSKRLKAGVLYREGINNFLNGGSKFFDRSYLQVQLKLTILDR